MSTKHLQLKPHAIRDTKTAWWYEENKGIAVIVEPNSQYTHVNIPWESLRKALHRKDKA
jgi:hypothetical protein